MPELPEVQTTVTGLQRRIINLVIEDVWSDYGSAYFAGKDNIKDTAYFKLFKKKVIGCRIVSIERRAKNILINLSAGKTMLVHMKMTGHLLYGTYEFDPTRKTDPWQAIEPESLREPINKHVRFVISFTNGKHLALSDVRRFARITLGDTDSIYQSIHLKTLGPEPMDASFNFRTFQERLLLRPRSKIKQVLTDQTIISGIGNIYADESLWRAGIHPVQEVRKISPLRLRSLLKAIKGVLTKGIKLGGDSMSDYRNVEGQKGAFQEHHYAYRHAGKPCLKKGCKGVIKRIVVGGRGTHYCPEHQALIT